MYTHIFSIQKYIDTTTLDYTLVEHLNSAIPKRLLDVMFSHCMSTYLFFQYPAYLEMHGYVKDIITLPKDTVIYKGVHDPHVQFGYPASFTINKDIAQYFGNTIFSTTLQDKQYIYLSPELSYVIFHLYKGFTKVPSQEEVIILSKIPQDTYSIELCDQRTTSKDYVYSKDEIHYPCVAFGASRHTGVKNKYVTIIKYQQYTKLLTRMLHTFYIDNTPNETIYLFNKYTNIWKKLVVQIHQLFDKDITLTYQSFMNDINNTNVLIFKLNTYILKILMYLVSITFEQFKHTMDDDLSDSIVIIHKELFYLIRYTLSDIDIDTKKKIEYKILHTRLRFSLDKLHTLCVGNTNDDHLCFYKTIEDLGYKDLEDIYNVVKDYIFMHVKYGSIYKEVSYVHTSISLLLHAIIEAIYPYIDHKTYNYIEKLHLNLL